MSLSPFYRLEDRNFVNITEEIIDLAKEFVWIFSKLLQPEQTFWLSQYYHYLGENPGCLNTPPTEQTLLLSNPTSHTIMSLDSNTL